MSQVWLQNELEENGGFCDCEVISNVFGGPADKPYWY